MPPPNKGKRYEARVYGSRESDDDDDDAADDDLEEQEDTAPNDADADTKGNSNSSSSSGDDEDEDAVESKRRRANRAARARAVKPRSRWNAAPSLACAAATADEVTQATSSLLPTSPDANISASVTLDSVGFEAVFMNPQSDILITARLKDMTALLRALRVNVASLSLPQQARYVLLLHALNNHLCHQSYPRTLRPLWVRYRENSCKCLRFEIVNRVIDFARRVLFESTLEELKGATAVSDFVEILDDLTLTEQLLAFTATHTVNTWHGPRRDYLDRVKLRLNILSTAVQAATSWVYGSIASLKAVTDFKRQQKLWHTATVHLKRCRDLLASTCAAVPLQCEGATEYTPLKHRCQTALNTSSKDVAIDKLKDDVERQTDALRTWAQKANTAFLDAMVQRLRAQNALGEVVCLQAVILRNGGWTENAKIDLEAARLAGVSVPINADRMISKLKLTPLPKRELLDLDRLMIDSLLSSAFHKDVCRGTLMSAIKELDEVVK